jgi:asparagine synthase (glutamine-hydrolysing)
MSSKFDARARTELARGQLAEARPDPALDAIRSALRSVESTPLATTLYLDGQLALVDDMLHYFDRASMAHSLEVRVPFLDHHLVEFAATIPDVFKVKRQETKAILKHAARGLIPDSIIDKPKQGFFREGVSDWFRAQTNGAIADYLLQPNAYVGDYVDSRALDRMVADHMRFADRGRNGHLLFAVLMLEVWLSTYVTRFSEARDTRQRIPA